VRVNGELEEDGYCCSDMKKDVNVLSSYFVLNQLLSIVTVV